MDRAKGILDEDIRQRGQLFRENGIVGFFFRMKAQIFQKKNPSRLQVLAANFSTSGPMQSGAIWTGRRSQLFQTFGDGFQTVFRIRLDLWDDPE